MNYPPIVSVIASPCTLLLRSQARRLTDSRSLFLNTVAGSGGFLLAGFQSSASTKAETTYTIPFLAAMLFAGLRLAVLWRSRKEPPLGLPSTLLFTNAAAALLASFTAYSI